MIQQSQGQLGGPLPHLHDGITHSGELLTALGGALGLLLAWLALYTGREWIFTVLDSWPGMVPEGVDVRVSGEMLFAPLVFLAALVLCVVLNLLSALIPAWYSLRKPIVNSLNEKR